MAAAKSKSRNPRMGYKVVDGLAADGQSFQQNYKQLSTRRTSLLQEKVPIVIDTAKVRETMFS